MDARTLLPSAVWVRSYRRSWLPRDLFAGLVLTAILVPAGMGYAEASGLPAIVGLYATLVPLLAYAVLGPSRILVLGPDSALLPLIAAVVVPLSAGDQARAVALGALLALVTGVVIIAAGVARLGFLTDLLSAPVRQGYLNGIALLVLVSQLPRLFGFSTGAANGLFDELGAFVAGVQDGQTNAVSLAIGVAALVVILGLRAVRPGLPGILVAVVGATIVSAAFDLAARSSIVVVGPLPVGLPPVSLPPLAVGDLFAVVPAALGIALVAATDTSVLSRTFAARRREEVDPDREFIALGGANFATGLLSGMPVSGSASRTPVAEAAGAQTQLTGVVSALLMAVMLVVAPGLLAALPTSALAAVVIAAALSLVDIGSIVRLWRLGSAEFWLAMISFLGVTLIGVIPGVFIAVGVSLLEFIRRAWRPHDAVLGRADGVKGYHDLTYYPDARQVPGLILFRFDAPLFFANADVFRDRMRARIAEADGPVRWVIVAAEPITDVDTTAAAALDELVAELDRDGITLAFAELKDPIKDKLKRYGALGHVPAENIFPTVGTAVSGYLNATGQSWTDWEDDRRST
ncbi:MAG TPA: sulfate permease [Candidatus Limnocylindrales bacterium]|nr:sulfate permease [Candidatus Limnocylindrales bacterium]